MLLAALGLGAVLTSCGGNDSPLSSEYYVENLSFNGGTYSGPVICDNLTSHLSLKYNFVGDISSVKGVNLSLRGVKEGGKQGVSVTDYSFSGGQIRVNFVVRSGTAPLSLSTGKASTQSIVVNPKVIGASYVDIYAFDAYNQIVFKDSSNALPVLSNCG